MAFTKEKIYNLAFGALLLQRQTTDVSTDTSNEVVVLNTHYDSALETTLADLDLDSTSDDRTLSLVVADPVDEWSYAYTYPSDCALLRRIKSTALKDNKTTRIPLRITIRSSVKVIYTNEKTAVGEIISISTPIDTFSAELANCVALRLAILGSPLIVGKGARVLRNEIQKKYILTKAEAQERDQRENFNFDENGVNSEFVEQRLE